ncbi:MAG: hypothetical protein MUD14_22010 [Hydrococcus sp. Prado102]|jgi:hypothetical protein|nr:hypothetical protein [Hydrococcus sp. Prado102]
MAVISIVTRNQNGNALTSIGGIPFMAILQLGEQVIGEQTVSLLFADTFFDNLEAGQYTAKVRHELVEPPLAQFDVTLMTQTELLQISFNYLEPERVLLNIRTLLVQQ